MALKLGPRNIIQPSDSRYAEELLGILDEVGSNFSDENCVTNVHKNMRNKVIPCENKIVISETKGILNRRRMQMGNFMHLVITFFTPCLLVDSNSFHYKLTVRDKMPNAAAIETSAELTNIGCASLCSQNQDCLCYGVGKKECFLLATVLDNDTCTSEQCSVATGTRIYKKILPEQTTTTTEQTSTSTEFVPTTEGTTNEETTTDTETPTTSTSSTTSEKTTTTTQEPDTTLSTSATFPTTATDKTTSTTEEPTTTEKATTTTEKPTTTTPAATTTTTKATTTKKPTTTTPAETTTTEKATTTTTTEKPTTTTKKPDEKKNFDISVKCDVDDQIFMGFGMKAGVFFTEPAITKVCYPLGKAETPYINNPPERKFDYKGEEKGVCDGFTYPAITEIQIAVRELKLEKFSVTCSELDEQYVDKDKDVERKVSKDGKNVYCEKNQAAAAFQAVLRENVYWAVLDCRPLQSEGEVPKKPGKGKGRNKP